MPSHKTVLYWPSRRRLFHRGRQTRHRLLWVLVAAACAALAASFR